MGNSRFPKDFKTSVLPHRLYASALRIGFAHRQNITEFASEMRRATHSRHAHSRCVKPLRKPDAQSRCKLPAHTFRRLYASALRISFKQPIYASALSIGFAHRLYATTLHIGFTHRLYASALRIRFPHRFRSVQPSSSVAQAFSGHYFSTTRNKSLEITHPLNRTGATHPLYHTGSHIR